MSLPFAEETIIMLEKPEKDRQAKRLRESIKPRVRSLEEQRSLWNTIFSQLVYNHFLCSGPITKHQKEKYLKIVGFDTESAWIDFQVNLELGLNPNKEVQSRTRKD